MPLPPERYHAFVSYTTREEEVKEVKPLVDYFLGHVLRSTIERELGELPVFYDGYALYELQGKHIPEATLTKVLTFAIEESEILLAFMSPAYSGSDWCRLEFACMATKRPRPWFDTRRPPPIEMLRENRPPQKKFRGWEAFRAARLRRKWDYTAIPRLGGPIVPIVWKGELDEVRKMPLYDGQHVFDWRGFAQMMQGVLARSSIPGASPVRVPLPSDWEATEEFKVLYDTADAILALLRRRRFAYAAEEREQ